MRAGRGVFLVFVVAVALAGALFGCSLLFPVSDDSAAGTRPPTYRDLNDPSAWSFHALPVPEVDGGTPAKLFGGAFDGAHVVFAPAGSTNGTEPAVLHALDTRRDFARDEAWSSLDLLGLADKTFGFLGACSDGAYVYLAPRTEGTYLRRPLASPPSEGGSWESYVGGRQRGHSTCVSGGRYVYFTPGYNGSSGASEIVRYDTTQAFTSVAFWEVFNVRTIDAALGTSLEGFSGSVFDGRYLYLVPNSPGKGIAVRYDTDGPFADVASWSHFDVKQLGANILGFEGATFDGRYIYYAPSRALISSNRAQSIALRFDTRTGFDDPASWTPFDLTAVNQYARGYSGAVFDGRFVYFVPATDTPTALLARFDTDGVFDDPASWGVVDLVTLDPKARGFRSAVFDGRYLYLVPSLENVVARFDARTPPSLSKLPASFY